ncbi:MAG: hypothetical protein ACK5RV_11840 [Flavobacterium sp.]|jgi:hypothetical protein|uniref:hypothetical protein n=1 Tax=Flavobacterium sp. TaxID=239 RepID=UPI0022BE6B2B|nr:hypothetical protein [Flavobacterium sp.]MCZ8169495.1 hypothetical protein [Flavobacterium sp.]MCZ8295923.1 hypothetical protein [Flavobacterium sp.]
MKRILLLVTILSFATACQQNPKAAATGNLPFYTFDQVIHYTVPVSKSELDSIIGKSEKSRKELGLLQIVTGNIPVSTQDSLFISNMDILGFEKEIIDPKKYPAIEKLFSKREPTQPIQPTCKSGYTDILVFRNKGKFMGSVKLNFECQRHQMVGQRYNDADFGQSGEYEALKKLLK